MIVCPKCGKEDVNVQMVSVTKKPVAYGIIYLCLVVGSLGILWFFLPKPKSKVVSKKRGVCNSCAHDFEIA